MCRWSRGEGLRRRGSHSPPAAQREVAMDGGAERVVRNRSKQQDTWSNRNNATERMESQQFDAYAMYGRRNARGRGRGWNHDRGGARTLRQEESDEAADRQRLLESLIDPQDVPRSGEYYEVKKKKNRTTTIETCRYIGWGTVARS